jgi:glycosyltransferase involved in cell wall biosynthesis
VTDGRPPRVTLVIPALNEEASLPRVLDALPRGLLHEIVVVDNGCTDGTPDVARERGARVVSEPRRGYGSACLAGIAAADAPDVIAFIDADFSDHPGELPLVLAPILDGTADLVVGSRVTGRRERGALLPQARFGNWLATRLMRWFWGVPFTDLGPFRAVRADALQRIGMRDREFGWTVEMQVKAARLGLRCVEVPVSYRARIGKSKITGTVRGTVRAGTRILGTIFREAWADRRGGRRVTRPGAGAR